MTRSNSRPSLSFVLAASLLASSVATPVRAAEPTAAEKTTARTLMHDGKVLRDAQDHAGALAKFQRAYALFATPITGLAVAREQIAVGQLVEARETLGAIERMPVRPTESEDGAKARTEATALLADLASKIAAESGQGGAQTKGDPAATATTTTSVATVAPVDEPKPTSRTRKTVGLATLAAGAVGVGVGGFLALSARSSYDSVKSAHCPTGACDPDGVSGIAAARSSAGTATIVMGLGAVVAVGGAVLWLTAPSAHGSGESKPGPPSVGLGLGSVTLAGRF